MEQILLYCICITVTLVGLSKIFKDVKWFSERNENKKMQKKHWENEISKLPKEDQELARSVNRHVTH